MKIGVIGGNGVAATNRLLDMIERKITQSGAFRDAHHPEMFIAQATQVPSRSMFLEGRGLDWRPDYIQIAKLFKSIGCDWGCMCCNTAHYAIEEIERSSGLRFINMLKEVALRVSELGLNEVELWVSDGARKFDLYGSIFKCYAPKVKIVYPSERRQKDVTRAICAVKTSARLGGGSDSECPLAIIKSLLQEATASVILGCTDLRVAWGGGLDERVVVDSLECLADAIVRLHKGV